MGCRGHNIQTIVPSMASGLVFCWDQQHVKYSTSPEQCLLGTMKARLQFAIVCGSSHLTFSRVFFYPISPFSESREVISQGLSCLRFNFYPQNQDFLPSQTEYGSKITFVKWALLLLFPSCHSPLLSFPVSEIGYSQRVQQVSGKIIMGWETTTGILIH